VTKLFATILLSTFAASAIAAGADANCPVTTQAQPPFVPPAPYVPNAPRGSFWYGTKTLWTWLRTESTWPKGGEKLFLWQEGYDRRTVSEPDILVTAKRLDAEAPVVTSWGRTNAGIDHVAATLTGIAIPTAGCWEITAQHDGHVLSFVVSVLP
jgi:hypothetical protein